MAEVVFTVLVALVLATPAAGGLSECIGDRTSCPWTDNLGIWTVLDCAECLLEQKDRIIGFSSLTLAGGA